jgi:hypothetical protein
MWEQFASAALEVGANHDSGPLLGGDNANWIDDGIDDMGGASAEPGREDEQLHKAYVAAVVTIKLSLSFIFSSPSITRCLYTTCNYNNYGTMVSRRYSTSLDSHTYVTLPQVPHLHPLS